MMNVYLKRQLKKDETWVTNTASDSSKIFVDTLVNKGFTSARLGNQAFDLKGKRLKKDKLLPVFMNASDAKKYVQTLLNPQAGGNEGEK